jgi:hypothetical protein
MLTRLLTENSDSGGCKNNLAAFLYLFGLFFEQTDRPQEAQASWQQALDIWETMNEDDIGGFMESFENTRNKLNQGANS